MSGRGRGIRVLHLTTVHTAGDVRIFHKECRTLSEAGYAVTLVAPAGEPAAGDSVTIQPLVVPATRWGRVTVATWRAFRAARAARAAIVHLHDPELLPMGMLLKALGERVIYDAHEDVPRDILAKPYLPPWLRPPVSALAAAVEGVAGRLLDGVVAATPPIARRFPPARTVMVMNYPRLEEFAAPGAEPHARRPLRVLYLGGVTETRGAREMLRAMEHVATPGAELVLAGRIAPPALAGDLAVMPGWARTRAVGYLSRHEVYAALAGARVGLVLLRDTAAYRESYPVKLFEYMAAGLPVVASDFPLWRDLVAGPGAGLLVDPADAAATGAAISWLLDHPAEAQAMGQRGRAVVQRTHHWEGEGERLVAFYDRLLARGSR
jgi:hypothetical protein